jgi:2-iminobutanoate/2-iminopropanoate deaminase
MNQIINTIQAPAAIGPYSQAVKVENYLFISGQLPIDPRTGKFAGNTIETQAEQSLKNLKEIITAADMTLQDIVKVTVYLANMDDFAKMNDVYSTFFTTNYPARVAVEVSKLPKNSLVEMEAIVYHD